MKKKYLLLTITAAVFLFFGCSKSNENIKPTTWTYHDTTYTAVTIRLDSVVGMSTLGGTDARGNYVNIIFNSFPTTNAIFNVTNNTLGPGNSGSNCFITVGNSGWIYAYTSTGKPGNTVTLTFSGDKMQASFNNITIANGSDTTSVSGVVTIN
jgi:hypothetical protein